MLHCDIDPQSCGVSIILLYIIFSLMKKQCLLPQVTEHRNKKQAERLRLITESWFHICFSAFIPEPEACKLCEAGGGEQTGRRHRERPAQVLSQ